LNRSERAGPLTIEPALHGRADRGERVLTALVDAAKQGDEKAFATLLHQVGDTCLAIAYRIVRDADAADDAVQASFITAWRRLPGLRDPERFEPWLHRILVRCCYAEARRGRKWAADVRVLDLAGASSPDETLTVDDRDQLERGFRRLSPEHRAVLVFHGYLGLTLAEVADRLDIPIGTVKSRLHHATASLRSALEADGRTPSLSQERLA
jgi:RNA polymerase sigma-70 factor (ECF subfamily)